MATLYLTEFYHNDRSMGISAAPVAQQPPIAEQVIAIGGGSVQSVAFDARTNLVCVSVDAACSIKFGSNPTATVTNARLPADAVIYYSVPIGQSFKIAVIANT
jgi:hypothetical protein